MRWVNKLVTVEDDGAPLERVYEGSGERPYVNVLLDAIDKQERALRDLRRDIETLKTAIAQWKRVA
jgi:hypothetical protein